MSHYRLYTLFYFLRKYFILSFVCFFFAAISPLYSQDYFRQAPDFEVVHKDGYKISLNSLKGKYVYLLFWASWCPNATTQMPNLAALYDKYNKARFVRANGFEVFTISLDEEKDKWLNAIKDNTCPFSFQCVAPKMFDSPVALDYNITRLPTAFLISPEGYILYENMTMPELDAFLAGNAESIPAMDIVPKEDKYNNNAIVQMNYLVGEDLTTRRTAAPKINNNCRIFVGNFGSFGSTARWQRLYSLGQVQEIVADNNSIDVYLTGFESCEAANITLNQLHDLGYMQAVLFNDNNGKNSVSTETWLEKPPVYYTESYSGTTSSTMTGNANRNTNTEIGQVTAKPQVGLSDTYPQYNSVPTKLYTPSSNGVTNATIPPSRPTTTNTSTTTWLPTQPPAPTPTTTATQQYNNNNQSTTLVNQPTDLPKYPTLPASGNNNKGKNGQTDLEVPYYINSPNQNKTNVVPAPSNNPQENDRVENKLVKDPAFNWMDNIDYKNINSAEMVAGNPELAKLSKKERKKDKKFQKLLAKTEKARRDLNSLREEMYIKGTYGTK